MTTFTLIYIQWLLLTKELYAVLYIYLDKIKSPCFNLTCRNDG